MTTKKELHAQVDAVAEEYRSEGLLFGLDDTMNTVYVYAQGRVPANIEQRLKERFAGLGVGLTIRRTGRFIPGVC